MRKSFLMVTVLTALLMFGSSGHCENLALYEDDKVSFEYDEDALGVISYNESATNTLNLHYDVTTQMYIDQDEKDYSHLKISIEYYPDCLDSSGAFLPMNIPDKYDYEMLNDGDLPEMVAMARDENVRPYCFYSKVVAYSEDYAIEVYYYPSTNEENNILCQTIYDSLKESDSFWTANYTIPEDFTSDYVYCNVELSDLGLSYAQEIIRIIEDYLDFSIDGTTAISQMSEVEERLDNYCQSTNYVYDKELEDIIVDFSDYVDAKSDVYLLEMLNELKMICKIE